MERTTPPVAVVVGGAAATAPVVLTVAVVSFVRGTPGLHTLASVGALALAAALAEHYPVPIEGVDTRGISLSAVIIVATVVLFGWEAAVLVAAIAAALQVFSGRPPLRVGYNVCVFVCAAAAGGLLAESAQEMGTRGILLRVLLAGIGQYGVNVLLIAAILAYSAREPFMHLLRESIAWSVVPVALMGSTALMLVILWQRSPYLSIALAGPLFALVLYQRSTHHALNAMRLALTDPLTGLGNHRHFHERLQRELTVAEETGAPLALCLVDLDNFKEVNDVFGHPTGDTVLAGVATRLRHGGEAFRLGGDEFAVLLPGASEVAAVAAAESILERINALRVDDLPPTRASCGIAVFPSESVSRDDLLRLTDSALYWAKGHGKNRVRVYRPDAIRMAQLERLAHDPDFSARLRAAASLAEAVDARDAHAGAHSQRVGDLAARIGARLGCTPEEVELLRLAGHLHDVGKLAIPEEILRKTGPISESERIILERHPQIGFRMLESLGIGPVAEWVLHHHERWDGGGYPAGLAGQDIPLGARIIFACDAWDSMTSDRTYREALDPVAALAEFESRAGTQFDVHVVHALALELDLISVPDHAGELG
jgi:diguanylate cyclase (GGDEF)-like protein